jgi:hypothetical protein
MKFRLFIASSILSLFSPLTSAGHVTYHSMYSSKDIIQGVCPTKEEAKADAISAKPKTYALDPGNSWAVQEIRNGEWMATRPIIRNVITK